MLKKKYNNTTATSLNQLFRESNKFDDLLEVIREDDVEVVTIATMYKSSNVFVAVYPMLRSEIYKITSTDRDTLQYIENYLYSIGYRMLHEFIGSKGTLNSVMYYSYSRVLMSGDDKVYNVIRKYINIEPTANMLDGYEHIKSLGFLRWLIESGKYSKDELASVTSEENNERYLEGAISYEEAKDQERRLLFHIFRLNACDEV